MSLNTFDKSTSQRRFERKLERDRSLRAMEEASSSVYTDDDYDDDISVTSSFTCPPVLSGGSKREALSTSKMTSSTSLYSQREPFSKRDPRRSRPIGGYYSHTSTGFHPSVNNDSDDDDDCSIMSGASYTSTSSASVATFSTFDKDKAERQRRRLIEREKQLRMMEEAASATTSTLMSSVFEYPSSFDSSSTTKGKESSIDNEEPSTPNFRNSAKSASVTPVPPPKAFLTSTPVPPPMAFSSSDHYKVRDVDLGPSPEPPPPRRGESVRKFLKDSEERFNSVLKIKMKNGCSSPTASSPRQTDAFIPSTFGQGSKESGNTTRRFDGVKRTVNGMFSRCVMLVGQMVSYVDEKTRISSICNSVNIRRWTWKNVLIVLLAVALVVATVDLTVSSIRHKKSSAAPIGLANCLLDANVTDVVRHESILYRILTSSISDPTAICNVDDNGNARNISTPQGQALDWIVNHDPRKLDPSHDALLQRYALAVFYFSTHREDASANGDGNSGDSEEEDKQKYWYLSADWMTDKGICMWFGVQCISRRGHDGNPTVTYDDDVDAVTHLNLASNGISGVLPPELFTAFDQMRVLDLSMNFLGSTIPSELGNLLSLEELNLEHNSLLGPIPSSIGSMTNLLLLNLGANQFSGFIPDQIEQLNKMEYLVLEENTFEGRISDSLGLSLPKLESLYIGNNSLTGTLPTTLGELANLKELCLRMNNLVGDIPSELGLLTKLQKLHLDDNGFGGTLPDVFSSLPSLNKIHVERNMLSGTLPQSIGTLKKLSLIHMDNNEFDGSIPDSWWDGLPALEEIYLFKNSLTGSISSSIGEMQNLLDVRLSRNRIGGSVPSEVGTLWNLRNFYVEDNVLTGAIPNEIGNLFHLEELRLYGNELSGIMPDTVCTLRKSTVTETGNGFTLDGTDVKVEDLGQLEFLAADCRGDVPKIQCQCCDNC